MFKQPKDSRQLTWESPDQKTHNKIDFILINNKWRNCVNNSRSFPSADIGSDHQLVIANIHLRFKGKPKPHYPKRYDVFKLKNPEIKTNYEIEICGRFISLLSDEDTDVRTLWNGVKAALMRHQRICWVTRKPTNTWISEEVIQLSEKCKRVKQEKLNDPTKRTNTIFSTERSRIRQKVVRISGWNVDKAHQAAKSKEVYSSIKKITITTIFQCSKNCGSPTRVTRLKVAPNMADPISLSEKRP